MAITTNKGHEGLSPEQTEYKATIDNKVAAIHHLLNGFTVSQAKVILEAAIYRLHYVASVQPSLIEILTPQIG